MIYRVNIYKFFIKNKANLFIIAILLLTLPLFFYKLGQSSLVSWDEAWHAVIAKNIVQTGELFHLKYNGSTFVDHPPGGVLANCY